MVDVSTVSITESFSFDDSPENRGKSVPTGNAITDAMSPDLLKVSLLMTPQKIEENQCQRETLSPMQCHQIYR